MSVRGFFRKTKKVDPAIRADVLFKAVAIIRRRKHEFFALLTIYGLKIYTLTPHLLF